MYVADCVSDTGRIRPHNEDNFLIIGNERLYVVADGMGGHSSGEVASQTAVDALSEFFAEPRDEWQERYDKALKNKKLKNKKASFEEFRLHHAIEFSNRSIFQKASTNALYHDMGTTIVGLLFGRNHVAVSHVGDSRIYRMRDEALVQITEDHSLVNEYIKLKILDPADSHKFPYRNVIVRALGLNKNVAVDTRTLEVKRGDVYLLCSDGLTDMVDDALILDSLIRYRDDLSRGCQALVSLANLHGGYDNITVMLVKAVDAEEWSNAVEASGADGAIDPDQTLELPKSGLPQGDDPVAAFAMSVRAILEAAIDESSGDALVETLSNAPDDARTRYLSAYFEAIEDLRDEGALAPLTTVMRDDPVSWAPVVVAEVPMLVERAHFWLGPLIVEFCDERLRDHVNQALDGLDATELDRVLGYVYDQESDENGWLADERRGVIRPASQGQEATDDVSE
ncbi:MAG: Stp1/IreP family PP2C-type Ser/Thr phosphatase [Myxococcales bacterium]|nr:Stp1/IreP family PP2C-type Ser/Thr phosphatase [Myxococcales bacterium]